MDIEHPVGTGYSGVGDLDNITLIEGQTDQLFVGGHVERVCFYTLRVLGPQALHFP